MSEPRLFTVEEANALIPELEQRFSAINQLRLQLRGAYDTLTELGVPVEREALASLEGPPEVRAARGRFRALVEALTESLAQIEEQGVAIKDLDIGLCDFLADRDGRQVWLCWQYGEKAIGWFHELDAGFTARQPLGATTTAPPVLH
jgi:hypothetical protein